MDAWFASGGATAAILAGMALEAVALTLLFRRTGRGVPPRLLLPNLGAGACLIAASGAALHAAWWGWVSMALLAGLALHLLDLRLRWSAPASP